MIFNFFVLLLIGGCVGLQMKPVRPDRHLQKDVPMATMPRHNSVNTARNKMMPRQNLLNVLKKKMKLQQNLVNMPENMLSNAKFPSWATSSAPWWAGSTTPWQTTTTAPWWTTTYAPWRTTTTAPWRTTTTAPWWTTTTNPWWTGTTTTAPWRTTTVTPGNRPCPGIIFVEQMTRDITTMRKQEFFNITKTLANILHTQGRWSSYYYAYAQYGNMVYRRINTADYFDFMRDVDQAEYNFTVSNRPNGEYTYLAPMLNEILNFLEYNYGQRYVILLMGEDSNIRDPTDAYSVAQSIAAYNANIYVLDYSHGGIPISIWPTLTGNKAYHIVDGTDLTVNDIVGEFEGTLLNDVLSGNC